MQQQPATIGYECRACEICLAHNGGNWSAPKLALQLTELHALDPDMFDAAWSRHVDMPQRKMVDVQMFDIMIGTVPVLHRAREDQRKELLATTWNYLTAASWNLDCWIQRIKEEAKDTKHIELMKYKLSNTTRGVILDFLSIDLLSLYKYLCTVKTNSYHTLERPIFWPSKYEFDATHEKTKQMLVDMLQYVIDNHHKPYLARIKNMLTTHGKNCEFVDGNLWTKGRIKQHDEVVQLLKKMLHHNVRTFAQTYFGSCVSTL